jgi:hypothetical protein
VLTQAEPEQWHEDGLIFQEAVAELECDAAHLQCKSLFLKFWSGRNTFLTDVTE